MDQTTAERLMAAALALDTPMGEIDSVISQIPDETGRAIFARALGEIFQVVNERLLVPIYKEHPALAPNDKAAPIDNPTRHPRLDPASHCL